MRGTRHFEVFKLGRCRLQWGLNSGPKRHISTGVLQTMVSGILLCWALEPECRIVMSRWPLGPPLKSSDISCFLLCLGPKVCRPPFSDVFGHPQCKKFNGSTKAWGSKSPAFESKCLDARGT